MKRPFDIVADNEDFGLRVLPQEGFDVGSIEVVRRPFALDGGRSASSPGQNKINFMPAFISPVMNLSGLQMRMQLIQDVMFPERSPVFGTKGMPTPVIANKTRIKPIHLGGRHDLRGTVRTERAQHVNDKSGL